ncbi:MAG: TIR domain-containing protein [Candidatus Omnitrophica bacterium]|nr:TIR domain-containing protein [Candidatus Omnitrophota bacterium]
MEGYAFISYSNSDKKFVQKLIKKMESIRIWVDCWNLDPGDTLPSKISTAIYHSKWFILVASVNSMKSRWVQYELNIALIKWLQDSDYKIIIVRIDNCSILPELSPFLFVDYPGRQNEALQKLIKVITNRDITSHIPIKEKRRRIVDRFKEIEAIERLFHEGFLFIYLWGMHGIGKTSIIERVSQEIFNVPLSRFPLTESHGILRLSLELAARSGNPLPDPGVSDNSLIQLGAESIIRLMEQGYLVFFDDLENALEEDGSLRNFLFSLFNFLVDSQKIPTPIILSSTQHPLLTSLSHEVYSLSQVIKIGPLDDKDLLFCLENWLRLIEPNSNIPDRNKLQKIVPNLFGYPLAARFAANLIMRNSIEILIKDISYFKNLRIDIAKQLLGSTRLNLSKIELSCLEALALLDTGTTMSELAISLQFNAQEIRNSIDSLTSKLIVFIENGKLQIHPIIKDYFWHRIYDSGKLKELANKMAKEAIKRLKKLSPNDEEFIHYCSKTYRLFALSGNLKAAQKLKYDFKEELREVSKRFYYARNYESALSYINLWLELNPNDNDIRWFKARCLTRLSKYEYAELELEKLENNKYSRYRLDHAWGLLERDKGQYEKAAIYFRKGLQQRPDYIPLLRDLGDVLDRLGDNKGSVDILAKAYNLAPRDSFVISKYVDVLEKQGNLSYAISILDGAIGTFPEDASIEHRMSILYERVGKTKEALYHARRSVSINPGRLPEAFLHLAALAAKNNNFDEAWAMIDKLPKNLTKKQRQVKDTIIAENYMRNDNLESARESLKKYKIIEDSYCADVSARIELKEAHRALSGGRLVIAKDRALQAIDIIELALKNFPDNQYLKNTLLRANKLLKEIA